jgi:hypothetical protein
VEAVEFGIILISLCCDLKNHVIVSSTLPVQRFLIINLVEKGYLLVVGYPMIFYILCSTVTMCLGDIIVGVRYGTAELYSRFGVSFNAIYAMHQPIMNLKTTFVSTT